MCVQTTEDSGTIIAQALSSVEEIATLPEVTVKIIDTVEDPNSTARDLQEVIKHDPALSMKVLKVVNSAFYGLPGQVADVDRAALLLGGAAVKNIAIAASLVRMFDGRQCPGLFTAKDLWRHSLAVGVAAKRISQAAGNKAAGDEIFLAGLIHDLGLLVGREVFTKELAEVCRRCRENEEDFLELEKELIGVTHPELGEALATKWRFPQHLRAAVGAHHQPEDLSDELRPGGLILRCADILCCQEKLGLDLTAGNQIVSEELLDALGIDEAQLESLRSVLAPELEEAEAVFGSGDQFDTAGTP